MSFTLLIFLLVPIAVMLVVLTSFRIARRISVKLFYWIWYPSVIAGTAVSLYAALAPIRRPTTSPLKPEVLLQIERLEEMQSTLAQLQDFISGQKAKLTQTEETISALEQERQKLKPIVEAERELVEAILQLNQDRAQSRAGKERFTGFLVGLSSSLLAGSLLIAFRGRRKKW